MEERGIAPLIISAVIVVVAVVAGAGIYVATRGGGENVGGGGGGENQPSGVGVSVSISPTSQSGANGTTLTYTVAVSNTGNVSDNYSLTVTDNAGWLSSVSSTSLTIPAYENRTTTLSVTVPENAPENTRDNITFTATSTENSAVKDNASCIARAISNIRRGAEVSITPAENSAENGGTVTFVITIKNTGNVTEDYSLSKTDTLDWKLTLVSSVTDVIPGENRQVTLSVEIPATAENGAIDNITVTATSQTDNTVSALSTCSSTVVKQPPTEGLFLALEGINPSGSRWTARFSVANFTGQVLTFSDTSLGLQIIDELGNPAKIYTFYLMVITTLDLGETKEVDAALDAGEYIAFSQSMEEVSSNSISFSIPTP